jgi:hypothetical protein
MQIEDFDHEEAGGIAAFGDDVRKPSAVTVAGEKSETIFIRFFVCHLNKAGLALSLVDSPTLPLPS